MTTTTIYIHVFHHHILTTLLLLYEYITIIDFLEELKYVRRRLDKRNRATPCNGMACTV